MRRSLIDRTTNSSTGKQPGKAMTLALCYSRILRIFLTALQDMNQAAAHSPVLQKVRARRIEKDVWGQQR